MSEPDKAKCGRPSRQTGLPCKNDAGKGTSHPGKGACKYHGSGSKEKPGGAQKRNRNALVTGEYETLYLSALPEEQRNLFVNLDPNPRELAEHNLRMVCLRIHRTLIRLRNIEENADDNGMAIASIQTHDGWQLKGKVDFSVTDRVAVTDTVLRFEESLTRLQTLKIKAIDALREALASSDSGEDRLASLVKAIDRSTLTIAALEDADEHED